MMSSWPCCSSAPDSAASVKSKLRYNLEAMRYDALQARARAAAAVGEGLADLAARWILSLGTQAAGCEGFLCAVG